ncbi:MAG: hypothetical protein DWP94_04330 [Flavobacterium sp.]|nr:MAG: hypothetical protein DWP94_04330 [Flavobacterium sp.]
MVVLKKLKAATLVESLVASAIILIVFVIASLSLNNVFAGTVNNDDFKFNNRVNELVYLAKHNKISIPFYEETTLWDVQIQRVNGDLKFEAISKNSKSEVNLILDLEN